MNTINGDDMSAAQLMQHYVEYESSIRPHGADRNILRPDHQIKQLWKVCLDLVVSNYKNNIFWILKDKKSFTKKIKKAK